jgi:hypothetical protein
MSTVGACGGGAGAVERVVERWRRARGGGAVAAGARVGGGTVEERVGGGARVGG